jgi:hypothetical protein
MYLGIVIVLAAALNEYPVSGKIFLAMLLRS